MSTTTIDLDEKSYGQLLRRTLPHIIRTDEECERLTKELLLLDEREDISRKEAELAELLTMLIDEYEERRFPDGGAKPLTERLVDRISLEGNRFGSDSREALHQQGTSKKARVVFPRERGPIHLTH